MSVRFNAVRRGSLVAFGWLIAALIAAVCVAGLGLLVWAMVVMGGGE